MYNIKSISLLNLLFIVVNVCYAQRLDEIENIALNYTLPNKSNNNQLNDPIIKKANNKTVGLLYWSWHMAPFIKNDPTNISEVLEKYPNAVNDYENPAWEDKKGRHH